MTESLLHLHKHEFSGWRAACKTLDKLRVRLTRKLAECVDDVDLSNYRVGDIFELPDRDARLLIAEGCAERIVEMRRTTDRRKEPREA